MGASCIFPASAILLEALRDYRRVKSAIADGAVWQSCRSRAANPVRGEHKLHARGTWVSQAFL
jgi:hypothetical protein